MNILIVEDDFGVRDTLKDFIEFLYDDINIHEAANGEEASKEISGNKFNIMITDQMMPDIKGSELIGRHIDKLTRDGTWIYVYSGQMKEELREHLSAYDQVKVIDKFTNPMFFKEIIDSYISHRS